MKGVGEEVVSQGVVSLHMGMERHYKRMRMCIQTSNEWVPATVRKETCRIWGQPGRFGSPKS